MAIPTISYIYARSKSEAWQAHIFLAAIVKIIYALTHYWLTQNMEIYLILMRIGTVCPRSLVQFTWNMHCMKIEKTSWTCRIWNLPLFQPICWPPLPCWSSLAASLVLGWWTSSSSFSLRISFHICNQDSLILLDGTPKAFFVRKWYLLCFTWSSCSGKWTFILIFFYQNTKNVWKRIYYEHGQ